MQVMNCNGKIWPLKNNVDFDLIVFGSNSKGKIRFNTEYNKADQQWKINHVELFTKDQKINII